MTTKPKTELKIVQPDIEQMEAFVTEAAKQTAPIVSRFQQHLNAKQALVNELTREREDFQDRRRLLKAQFDAADAALAAHEADIDATLELHAVGISNAQAAD